MADSHLCLSCGSDLARVRARQEPHYGLPLVICPACGAAAVRRRHPLVRGWRTLRQLGTSAGVLAFQVAALGAGVGLVTSACIALGEDLVRGRLGRLETDQMATLLLMLVILSVALGTWLTAGLRHWRRSAAWVFFGGLVLVLLAADTVMRPVLTLVLRAGGFAEYAYSLELDEFVARSMCLAGILAVATAGIPLGTGLGGAGRILRRALVRGRRRRLRARRALI